MLHQIRKLFRNLYSYARRHPVKVFMLVIMPLITGGALAGVLKQFGIRLPAGLGSLAGGYGGSRGGGFSSFGSDFGSGGGGLQNIMNLAKMFM